MNVFLSYGFLDICQGVGLLNHMVTLFLDFSSTNLHFHPQGRRFPFLPQPFQHLLFIDLFLNSERISVK